VALFSDSAFGGEPAQSALIYVPVLAHEQEIVPLAELVDGCFFNRHAVGGYRGRVVGERRAWAQSNFAQTGNVIERIVEPSR
jgi:hypothetical protein